MTKPRLTAETIVKLTDVLTAENEALRNGRPGDALGQLPERVALIEALEAGLAGASNMLPRGLGLPVRALLKAAEENQKLLAAVASGLKEADELRAPPIAYTAQGSSVATAPPVSSRKL